VRLLLNLIWLIFGGLLMALGYAIVALVMFILIITIPFGIASARIALFCLWPFGRTLIRRLGLANFKLIPVSLTPFGRDIVDIEQARRLGFATQVAVPADPSRR
jgi:uncharacterized membrane protein YccF (DUF307 family)